MATHTQIDVEETDGRGTGVLGNGIGGNRGGDKKETSSHSHTQWVSTQLFVNQIHLQGTGRPEAVEDT